MANVAEGAGRGGNREFVQFLVVARGSAAEVRSHLYVALDVDYVDQEVFNRLASEVRQIEFMTGALIERLKRTPHNGSRTKPPAL